MKILLFCQYPEGYNDDFRRKIAELALGAETYYYDEMWTEERYHQALAEAEIIVGHFNPADLRYCRNLKLIQLDIAGADAYIRHPDLPADTVICNASGAYGTVVAEHAVALAFALCRDIHIYAANRLEHKWDMVVPDKPIEDSTLLVIGAGDIGCKVAGIMRRSVRRIIGARRVIRETPEDFDEMITLDRLNEYIPQADIIICALPSTPDTVGLMNSERLGLMKEDSVIVNVGRGSLIPMDDLYEALSRGSIRGAGIDVFEQEPLPPGHPLWNCSNIIITPHSAGNAMTQTSPTNMRIYDIIYKNISNYINGRPLSRVVDPATGYRRTMEGD